jgi:hypothetical protein
VVEKPQKYLDLVMLHFSTVAPALPGCE